MDERGLRAVRGAASAVRGPARGRRERTPQRAPLDLRSGAPDPGEVTQVPCGQPQDPNGQTADLRVLKRVVQGLVREDAIRRLIESEPDALPLRELAVKADSWVRLLAHEAD